MGSVNIPATPKPVKILSSDQMNRVGFKDGDNCICWA